MKTRLVPLVALVCGCYAWHLDRGALAQTPQPRTKAELWVRGSRQVVHGIRVRPDSVSGVPYWQPTDCDSCRLTWALTQIDSVRVEREQPVADLVIAVALIGAVAFVLALRAGIGGT